MRRKIDLWTFDLARRSFTLVDNIGEIHSPVWGPDGNTLIYGRTSLEQPPHIMSRSADADGETKTLTQERAGTLLPNSASPDGKTLLLTNEDESPRQKDDIFLMQLDGSTNPQSPLVATNASECDAVFSPDGKWFAYVSNETGRNEVYVRTFPDIGRKWQISTDGGFLPRWSRGGDKVFFLNNDVMYACSITKEGGFLSGRPEKVFDLKGIATTDVWNVYDILPDDSFVMVEPAAWELEPLRIHVVVNWASELIKN
jgi:Tol biopolymer transport system component